MYDRKTYLSKNIFCNDISIHKAYYSPLLGGGVRLLHLVRPLSVVVVEDYFAHAHTLRRHFYELVFLDIFERLFEREDGARNDACLVVRAAGTCVGKLFRLRDVDYEVVVVNVLAHHFAVIYLFARQTSRKFDYGCGC